LLAPQFEEELRQFKTEDTFVELVRRAIQNRLTGHRPSIDVIAQTLHMSSRTVQRRLQDAGYNYQRVLDEARPRMARYYLSNSVLELNEAAYLLGLRIRTRLVVPSAHGREFHPAIGGKLTVVRQQITGNGAVKPWQRVNPAISAVSCSTTARRAIRPRCCTFRNSATCITGCYARFCNKVRVCTRAMRLGYVRQKKPTAVLLRPSA